MEAGKTALRHRIFFGKKLWQRIRTGDIEFSRKATLLVTIACLALSMLVIFSAVSFLHGDYFHSAINAAVFCVVGCSFSSYAPGEN
jgi:hypothetical protein